MAWMETPPPGCYCGDSGGKLSFGLPVLLNRSNASYRLKHRINLQDIFLYGFEDNLSDVEERGDVDLRVTLILAWALTFCWVFFW